MHCSLCFRVRGCLPAPVNRNVANSGGLEAHARSAIEHALVTLCMGCAGATPCGLRPRQLGGAALRLTTGMQRSMMIDRAWPQLACRGAASRLSWRPLFFPSSSLSRMPWVAIAAVFAAAYIGLYTSDACCVFCAQIVGQLRLLCGASHVSCAISFHTLAAAHRSLTTLHPPFVSLCKDFE